MTATYDTMNYQLSHGKQPRGHGNWALVPADYNYRAEPPADGIVWVWGYFTEAKQQASRLYPSVPRWKVLP